MQNKLLFLLAILLLILASYLLYFSLTTPVRYSKMPPPYARKECVYQTDNPRLRIYNDILIELVENHFYNLYLGEELVDSVWHGSRLYELQDSTDFYTELGRIYSFYSQRQKSIFHQPEKWGTFCLDTALQDTFVFKDILGQDTLNADERMRAYFGIDAQEWQSSFIDSFQTAQTEFQYDDFQTCTFGMAPITVNPSRFIFGTGIIGYIQFSKVVLSKNQTMGWLYYAFYCGGKCGMGDLLTVEKVKGRWKIKKTTHLWIS